MEFQRSDRPNRSIALQAHRRLGRQILAAALLVASLSAACGVSTAFAAEYQVAQCAEPDGTPSELSTSLISPAADDDAANLCATGGGYRVTAPGNALSGTWHQAGIVYALPSTMATARITRIWSDLSVAGKAAGAGSSGWFGMFDLSTATAWGALETFSDDTWDGEPRITVDRWAAGGSRAVGTLISCAMGCAFLSGPTITLHRAVVIIDDSTLPNPAVMERTGLLDGQGQKGTRTLSVNASDSDSGVESVVVKTDAGHVVGVVRRGSTCSFTRPIPCPQSWPQAAIPIDTTALPAGPQTLTVETNDAAGNVRLSTTPSFTVGTLPRAAETPVVVPSVEIPASSSTPPGGAVVDREQKMATARYGASVVITGKLTDGLGQPLASVPLTVYEQVQRAGDPWRRVAEITSDAQGAYAYRASASASKTMRFVYQGSRDGQPYTATREVVLGVHARMAIGAQRHSIAPGHTMRLDGSVGLAELPKAGAWVQIQVRDGALWRTIDTRRTSATGRWHYSHQMTRSHNTTFQFRAKLQTASDLPALPSTSGATRVHVR
jgi:hypothetical protein